MFYPTKPGTSTWNSLHWNNRLPRSLERSPDPYDPTGLSHKRGTGNLTVDGEGILTMGGRQPRIYVGFGKNKFWRDVEVTVYFQRVSDDDKSSSGLIIATRAGYLGHTSDAPCSATTYFGRIRNDGDMDFMKELKHTGGDSRERKPVWNSGPLPYEQWIGSKFVIYNVDNDQHVKMELYRDLTEAEDGGSWELLGETVDSGGWMDDHDCNYAPEFIPVQGGGVVFVLSSEVHEARYKWLTVREIALESGTGGGPKPP